MDRLNYFMNKLLIYPAGKNCGPGVNTVGGKEQGEAKTVLPECSRAGEYRWAIPGIWWPPEFDISTPGLGMSKAELWFGCRSGLLCEVTANSLPKMCHKSYKRY